METVRVPLYLSRDVVFPGQLVLLPLDGEAGGVIRACYEAQQPLGIVFAGEGRDAPADVGVLAYVAGHRVKGLHIPNSIWLLGNTRMQIAQFHDEYGYPEATVHLWPWHEQPSPPWWLMERVGRYLQRYIASIPHMLPITLMPEVLRPHTATLGVLCAVLIPLRPVEKQRLLEIPTAWGLLQAVLRYMRLYAPLAERLAQMVPHLDVEMYETVSMN